MTQDVAWTWKNKWGGRVFCTTLGHKNSFENRSLMRLFINGICWAAGEKVPSAKTKILPLARLKSRLAKSKKAETRADARNKQTGKKKQADQQTTREAGRQRQTNKQAAMQTAS